MEKSDCLIYCNCGADIITEKKKNTLSESFKKLNLHIFELKDICAFSLNEKEFFNTLENKYSKKYIVACYPRAIENMFHQNKIGLSNFDVLNFRELSEKTIIEKLKKSSSQETPQYEVLKSSLKVPAWYPIIDKSRCTLCGQCAHFCVFGVYKYNKKSLEVVHPLACKNHCPACGRTCPESAIIFPRLPENSALSGDIPGEEKLSKPTKNQGLFVMLNERNSMRKNIFKKGLLEQAEKEKLQAIEELKKGLENK